MCHRWSLLGSSPCVPYPDLCKTVTKRTIKCSSWRLCMLRPGFAQVGAGLVPNESFVLVCLRGDEGSAEDSLRTHGWGNLQHRRLLQERLSR